MKHVTVSIIAFGIAAFGQTGGAPAAAPSAAPAVSPDTVILKVSGKPVTSAEFERILTSFPPEIQQSARASPKTVMQNYYLMQSLGRQAVAEKLDQLSPYKEQLELQRVQFLATTLVNRRGESTKVSPEEQKQRYERDKVEKLEKAKIRAILIMFGENMVQTQVNMADPNKPQASPVSAVREEAEAKKIVAGLVQQLRAGADFAELAKQKSEDKNSAANGGDFGVIKRGDRIPEDIKNAVFALKPGEISDPIRQPMGYYIVKMEERSIPPFEEVRETLEQEMRKERFDEWMNSVQKEFEITIEAPEAFPQAAIANPQQLKK
jgi:peptidyl-prolyl cis-trans isomerase C